VCAIKGSNVYFFTNRKPFSLPFYCIENIYHSLSVQCSTAVCLGFPKACLNRIYYELS